MRTATATCDACLDGRHIRCRRPCACNVCATRRGKSTATQSKPKRNTPQRRIITDEHINQARELLAQPHPPSIAEIARRLDVDRSNLYRHLYGPAKGQRKPAVPRLANPKPITSDIITEAARRIAAKEYSSFSQLAYDLGVERTGLYKHLKKRDLLP